MDICLFWGLTSRQNTVQREQSTIFAMNFRKFLLGIICKYAGLVTLIYSATKARNHFVKMNHNHMTKLKISETSVGWWSQWELFLSEVNNRTTIAAIETNNETYCLQKRIERWCVIIVKILPNFYFVQFYLKLILLQK